MTEQAGQRRGSEGLVAAGYVTAILLPIVGFFLGLALVIKDRVAHGVIVMVLSVVIVVVAWGNIASDLATSSDGVEFATPAVTPCSPWNDLEVDC